VQPKSPPQDQSKLFRPCLVNPVDPKHPLVRLAELIAWDRFAEAFRPLYRESLGWPVRPKHLERLTIDTTVQPRAVTHPANSKLIHRGGEWGDTVHLAPRALNPSQLAARPK
jgi:hypothetical protein